MVVEKQEKELEKYLMRQGLSFRGVRAVKSFIQREDKKRTGNISVLYASAFKKLGSISRKVDQYRKQ